MKSVVSRILPAIVIMLFVGFIAYIHLSGLRPSFSVLQENNISNLKTGEVLYFGSSGCGACQEFNKVLKEYQDETHTKIYYWDATDTKIVRKEAEIKIYNTPTIVMRKRGKLVISQGYKNLKELKTFVES